MEEETAVTFYTRRTGTIYSFTCGKCRASFTRIDIEWHPDLEEAVCPKCFSSSDTMERII
jgi:hypothetical protein